MTATKPTGSGTGLADSAHSARLAPAVVELRGVGLPGHAHGRPLSSRWPRPAGHHRRRQRRSGPSLNDDPANGRAADPSLLDLTVRRGELVTLTGPAGSGKSALLSVVGLLDRPARGSYLLNGIDTTELGDRDRTALRGRQVGMQFQSPHLLSHRSALDNVALPLRYADMPRRHRTVAAFTALDLVGLAEHATVTITRLSAAQHRLVAIARALVADPILLLFDDPTASLDPAMARRVISLLVGLCRHGATVLVATDDQLAAAYSSQLVTLAGGTRVLDWPGDGQARLTSDARATSATSASGDTSWRTDEIEPGARR